LFVTKACRSISTTKSSSIFSTNIPGELSVFRAFVFQKVNRKTSHLGWPFAAARIQSRRWKENKFMEKRGAENSSDASGDLAALNREKARLRLAGVIVLSLGLVSAGVLYWARTRDSNLDQYREAQARAESRQMQILYGTSGGLTADLTNALKQPANQALIIAVVSALLSGACFYLGRPLPSSTD
jgi:hypothetical protein